MWDEVKDFVELPICEPIYSTYHFQGAAGAILVKNPTVRNWYLNEVMILQCNRKFLNGYTTPEINIVSSYLHENPYILRQAYPTRFIKGHLNAVIKNMLDEGYYVLYIGIDDYYIKGKSWYKKRHFDHDGLICGYDQKDKTFSIFAYDENWIYKKFKTPQKCLEQGRRSTFKRSYNGRIAALSVKPDPVDLNPELICKKLREYLDSSLGKYPTYTDDVAYGIVVHDYIAMYLDKLYDGSIPHSRMDWRVFRLIWEHKRVMFERLRAVEEVLGLPHDLSESYFSLVKDADHMRMLYAAYHIKERKTTLTAIKKRLLRLKNQEKKILQRFVETVEKELGK
ncbi:MAG: hypothetical protein E7525_04500 [Ruminococcaceae bacterium]|nr:hypothetical protein [Oscillospiraceae bacterium]